MEKISTKLRRGIEIAKELGIEQGTGTVAYETEMGNQRCCSLGMIALAELETFEAVQNAEDFGDLWNSLNINEHGNQCLWDKVGTPPMYSVKTIGSAIYTMNDAQGKSAEEIATILEECGY